MYVYLSLSLSLSFSLSIYISIYISLSLYIYIYSIPNAYIILKRQGRPPAARQRLREARASVGPQQQ